MPADSQINDSEQWNELSEYLFDLANMIHEHRDMLFRLSDKAKAEAEKLRQNPNDSGHHGASTA